MFVIRDSANQDTRKRERQDAHVKCCCKPGEVAHNQFYYYNQHEPNNSRKRRDRKKSDLVTAASQNGDQTSERQCIRARVKRCINVLAIYTKPAKCQT